MLLIFTDLDATLLDHETYSFEEALPALQLIKDKEIKGINVTLPYKKSVIPFLTKTINEANETHSVNTIMLDENGNLGVKIVNEQDRVQFKPINIVGGSEAKTFVTGLPDSCDVIIVGHGFVMHGQIVKAVAETESPGKQS